MCGSFEQRGKSRLLKMFVASQRARLFPLARDDKRGAIGQRPFLIRILMKLKGIGKDHAPGWE
jgi:predicted NUDIX family NTP pyrophosphohydrolase